MNPLLSRVSVAPNVCFGKLCIRGTRIDFLASGESRRGFAGKERRPADGSVLADFGLTMEDFQRMAETPLPEESNQ
jgi:hypothetical protein